MAKLTLSDVSNLQNESSATGTLASNNDLIEEALEGTLSRDGTAPNQMLAELDMNSHAIINLPDANADDEPVTYGQFSGAIEALEGSQGELITGSIVTLGENSALTAERILTAGTGLSLTDGGAGSTVTLAVSDPELLGLMSITSAADTMPYFTGAGSAATTSLTSAARTILDDASVSDMRTTLGLGTAALLNDAVRTDATQTLTNKTISTSSNTITTASASAQGVVELATDAEVLTGTDTARAITPAGLTSLLNPALNVLATGTTTSLGTQSVRHLWLSASVSPITSFGTAAQGIRVICRVFGAFTITNNAAIICPGGRDIQAQNEDTFEALSLGSGNWKILWYQSARGLGGVPIQTEICLFRDSYNYTPGPVSAAMAEFPGTALSASSYAFYGNELVGRKILGATWAFAWIPTVSGGANAGLQLVTFDSGPTNISSLALYESNATSPITSGTLISGSNDITSTLQTFCDQGLFKFLGHRMYGNGTDAPRLYWSTIYVRWA